MGRIIRPNQKVVTSLVALPDQFAIQAASLGLMTNTYSPASAGVHTPGSTPRGPGGLPGYGVNRFAGRLQHAVQTFGQAVAPISNPPQPRVGFGAGTSGQPGLPNTGDSTGGISSVLSLSWNPLGRAGLGEA